MKPQRNFGQETYEWVPCLNAYSHKALSQKKNTQVMDGNSTHTKSGHSQVDKY